jgi:hypothetical protein
MKNNSLLALTASALALPGFSTNINADTPPINTSLEYKLTSYKEGNLPKQELLAGSAERYDITVHQFSVNVRRQTLLDKVSSDLRDTLAHLG